MTQPTLSTPSSAHRSAQLLSEDGTRLHHHVWPAVGETTAVLAVVHGYGEHGGRYDWLAEAMTPPGYAVHVYDLRGHGLSSGERGQVGRFADYLDDTKTFLEVVAGQRSDVPLFLLGHSLGGLIAARYVESPPAGSPPLDGLILSSPFLRLAEGVDPLRALGARLLSRLWPGRDIGNTVRAADLSHEPNVVSRYETDPLIHHVAPARWAAEMLAAQDAASAAAADLTLPLLVLSGEDDAVTDPAATHDLFATSGAADKTERVYAGFYHELFNETGRAQVFADLAAWLAARTS